MLVFDIKRYSINDGPGVRITIFMKGCPLSCVWCHNPEGVSPQKEKLYTKKKCIRCQTCVNSCPQHALSMTPDGIVTDPSRCILCGKCAEVCPTTAMEISGKEYTDDQLMREIDKETLVMDESHGGVTFCGGEPLMHPDELLSMLRRCGEREIHRCVDTTLFCAPKKVQEVMGECELFLVDLKQMDSEKHKKYCGIPNETILQNLKMIAEAGADFWIRIPLIENVNDDEENIQRSADFLASLPWKSRHLNLLPYHDIGKGKHEKLGTIYNPLHYPFAAPSKEVEERCIKQFEAVGITATIGG